MDSVSNARRFLVGGVVAVSLVAWLWFLQLLAEIGAVRDHLFEMSLAQARGSFLSGIVLHQLGFFSQAGYLRRTGGGSRMTIAYVVATLVVLVVVAVLVWLATSGARGGPTGAVSVFFTAWAAALPVCALAGAASTLVLAVGRGWQGDFTWLAVGNGLARGAGSAAWWGWVPALLGALVWLLVSNGARTPAAARSVPQPPAPASGPRLQKS